MRRLYFGVLVLVVFGLFGFGAEDYQVEQYLMSTQEARQHALLLALLGTYNLEGLKPWDGAMVGPGPTKNIRC